MNKEELVVRVEALEALAVDEPMRARRDAEIALLYKLREESQDNGSGHNYGYVIAMLAAATAFLAVGVAWGLLYGFGSV